MQLEIGKYLGLLHEVAEAVILPDGDEPTRADIEAAVASLVKALRADGFNDDSVWDWAVVHGDERGGIGWKAAADAPNTPVADPGPPPESLPDKKLSGGLHPNSSLSSVQLSARGWLVRPAGAGAVGWEEVPLQFNVNTSTWSRDNAVWRLMADVRHGLGLPTGGDKAGLPNGHITKVAEAWEPKPSEAAQPVATLAHGVQLLLALAAHPDQTGGAWAKIDAWVQSFHAAFIRTLRVQGRPTSVSVKVVKKDRAYRDLDVEWMVEPSGPPGAAVGGLLDSGLSGRIRIRVTRKMVMLAARLLGQLLAVSRFATPASPFSTVDAKKASAWRKAAMDAAPVVTRDGGDAAVDVSALLAKAMSIAQGRLVGDGKSPSDDQIRTERDRLVVSGPGAFEIDGTGLAAVDAAFEPQADGLGGTLTVAFHVGQNPDTVRQRFVVAASLPSGVFQAQLRSWASLFVPDSQLPPT